MRDLPRGKQACWDVIGRIARKIVAVATDADIHKRPESRSALGEVIEAVDAQAEVAGVEGMRTHGNRPQVGGLVELRLTGVPGESLLAAKFLPGIFGDAEAAGDEREVVDIVVGSEGGGSGEGADFQAFLAEFGLALCGGPENAGG